MPEMSPICIWILYSIDGTDLHCISWWASSWALLSYRLRGSLISVITYINSQPHVYRTIWFPILRLSCFSLVFVILCFRFFVLKTFSSVVYSTGIPFSLMFRYCNSTFSFQLPSRMPITLFNIDISRHLQASFGAIFVARLFRPRTWTYLYISVYLISSQRTPFQAWEVYREKEFLKL